MSVNQETLGLYAVVLAWSKKSNLCNCFLHKGAFRYANTAKKKYVGVIFLFLTT